MKQVNSKLTEKLVTLSTMLDEAMEHKLSAKSSDNSKEMRLKSKELSNAHAQISILKKDIQTLKIDKDHAQATDKVEL